jgi:two-component system, NtrC family, response regulator AtoC
MSRACPRLLIVEDDFEYRQALEQALMREFSVSGVSDVEEAHRSLDSSLDLVLLDVRLTNEEGEGREGLRLLEAIRQILPQIPVVMMTAYGDIDLAVEAMKLGATDFVQKARVDIREFRKVLRNALERSRLARRVAELEEEIQRLEPWELVGDHPSIHEIRKLVGMVALDGYSTVLIRGETGTGKELVARAVHMRGWRKEAPFVSVALPALAPTLVERELFGHVRGAFTDARESRPGYIEKAAGGVLFLDEIGELTGEIQPKLLRFLDNRTYAAVGSTKENEIDIQVVCATNRNLEEALKAGAFREDLYYRLRTVEITLPALRQRPEDIPLLVDHFLFQFRLQGRTRLAGITRAALTRLAGYSFPGNVRELRSVIERAMMLANVNDHALIDVDDLPLEVQNPKQGKLTGPGPSVGEGIDLDAELARVELAYMEKSLELTEGRKTEAWRLLGLNDRFSLLRRVKRIREQYPQLLEQFPLVRSRYAEHSERSS